MDCIVHAVAKSRTQLSKFHFHFHPSFTDEETEGGLERKISDSPPPKPSSWTRIPDHMCLSPFPLSQGSSWDPGFKTLTCMMSVLLLKIFIYGFKISKWKAGVSRRRWLLHLSPALSRSPSPSTDSHREWAKEDLTLGPQDHAQSPSQTVTHPARAAGSCRKTYPWVWWWLIQEIGHQCQGGWEGRNNLWWGLEAPRKGSEFLLQAQHSRNGAKKRGSWEEVGGGGRGRGTRPGCSTEWTPSTQPYVLRHTPTWHNTCQHTLTWLLRGPECPKSPSTAQHSAKCTFRHRGQHACPSTLWPLLEHLTWWTNSVDFPPPKAEKRHWQPERTWDFPRVTQQVSVNAVHFPAQPGLSRSGKGLGAGAREEVGRGCSWERYLRPGAEGQRS